MDVRENNLSRLHFEADNLKELTLVTQYEYYRNRQNNFNCTCDNVNTFVKLMDQLGDKINEEELVCSDGGVPKSGKALNSILKVKAFVSKVSDTLTSIAYLQKVSENLSHIAYQEHGSDNLSCNALSHHLPDILTRIDIGIKVLIWH